MRSEPEIEITTSRFGNTLVVQGPWKKEYFALIKKHSIEGLTVVGLDDLAFLQDLPHLKALTAHSNGCKMKAIEHLENLEYLRIYSDQKETIDFSNFHKLKEAYIHCNPSFIDLLRCNSLELLVLDNSSQQWIDGISALTNLDRLLLMTCSAKSLDPLRHLTRLRKIRMTILRKLESSAFLEDLQTLNYLMVQNCNSFNNMEHIGRISNLEFLDLYSIGEVESLRPLFDLDKLKMVVISGKTKILDKDFSGVENLPNLGRLYLPGMKSVRMGPKEDPMAGNRRYLTSPD